jgi:hypothetical protein
MWLIQKCFSEWICLLGTSQSSVARYTNEKAQPSRCEHKFVAAKIQEVGFKRTGFKCNVRPNEVALGDGSLASRFPFCS